MSACACENGPHYLTNGLPCRCRGCLGTPGAVHVEAKRRPPRGRARGRAHPHPSARGSAGARERVQITLDRTRRGWAWARQHPWPAAIGTGVTVGLPALEWVNGGAGGQVGEVADVIAAAAVAALWRQLGRTRGLAIAATAGAAGLTGWLGPLGHPVEQGGAQVAVALGVGAALWGILRPRRSAPVAAEPGGRDVVAEMRRAMIASGICRNPGGGQPLEPPRLVRGGIPDPDAAVLRLSWALPDGVSLQRVRAAEETLSHRLAVRLDGAAVRILAGEDGAVVTEIRRGRLPHLVTFAEFYRQTVPVGGLVVGVGMSRGGAVWLDFGATPHALIAGMPQEGKSAAERQMLTRLALEHSPDEVRFALVDVAKRGVEFHSLGGLPHALGVATTATEALELLAEVEATIEPRWEQLGRAVAAGRIEEPDIAAWLAAGGQPWPRIVVAVDELAELTAAGDKRLREAAVDKLGKIARVGRAAGAHLLLATQRPDAEAVPGQMRACVDGALCFRVATDVNSRVVLGNNRGVHLPEIKGRALWQIGASLEEVQAPFLSAKEARELLERRWGRRPVATVPQRPVSMPEDEDALGPNVVRLR